MFRGAGPLKPTRHFQPIAQFAQAVGVQASDQAMIVFLDSLVESATARKIEAYRCPVPLVVVTRLHGYNRN